MKGHVYLIASEVLDMVLHTPISQKCFEWTRERGTRPCGEQIANTRYPTLPACQNIPIPHNTPKCQALRKPTSVLFTPSTKPHTTLSSTLASHKFVYTSATAFIIHSSFYIGNCVELCLPFYILSFRNIETCFLSQLLIQCFIHNVC